MSYHISKLYLPTSWIKIVDV